MTAPLEADVASQLRAIWNDDDADPVEYRRGRISFTVRGDSLSNIRYDDVPVVRAVRFIVRDGDWRTIPAVSTSVETQGEDRLALRVRTRGHGVDVEWTGLVEFTADSLSFRVVATAGSSFLRNRIGLVLLHPPGLAGQPLEVVHPRDASGSAGVSSIVFPEAIAPHQPATDVAGYRWRSDGIRVSAEFDGDTFEMEDQRNWTDASFKTYSTPLSLPFPVRVEAGDRVEQAVVLRFDADAREPRASAQSHSTTGHTVDLDVRLEPTGRPVPDIGVGASTAPSGPGRPAPVRSAALGRATVLVELQTGDTNWPAALARAIAEADRALDVRIVAPMDGAQESIGPVLDALAAMVADAGSPRLVRLGVFDVKRHLSERVLWAALCAGVAERPALVDAAPELVGGVRSHFTEVNRGLDRIPDEAPSLSFSITAQMHDRGRDQVIESLAMQRLVAEQAVRAADGRPVHIGPVTLRARFNAVATSGRSVAVDDDLRSGYGAELVDGSADARQRGRGFAAWLVASASALCVPGVSSATFAETWGPRGFVSADGEPYPAAEVFSVLAETAGWELLVAVDAATGEPLGAGPVAVFAARPLAAGGGDSRPVVLVANASEHPASIRLHDAAHVLAPGTSLRL